MERDKKRVHIFISGRVQNVFFRASAKSKAEKIGVFGWIRNLLDGRVEAVYEGERKKVEKMIDWSRRGPFFAKVNNIEIISEKYQEEFNFFEIR